MSIARVLVFVSVEKLFDYSFDETLNIEVGSLVKVPFGKAIKQGYVLEIVTQSSFDKLKPITEVLDFKLSLNLINLGKWIANYYCCSIQQSFKLFLPKIGKRDDELKTYYSLRKDFNISEYILKYPTRKAQIKIINFLASNGSQLKKEITKKIAVSSSVVKTLLEKNILEEYQEKETKKTKHIPSQFLTLNEEQQICYDKIVASINKNHYKCFLLQGVTSSGKTELYMQAINVCLQQNKQAIVLVPEISLTPQASQRFFSKFQDKVVILHSALSLKEKNKSWQKIKEKKAQVILGARSSLFVPLDNLGLIIVDEEHDSSYKQNETPRYHARDTAVMRGYFAKCVVILGSATPSFESLLNVEQKKYTLLKMQKRTNNASLPDFKLIDMRYEGKDKGSIFSQSLIEKIYDQLNNNMQSMLFLNRRGHSKQIQCIDCFHVESCQSCDRPFTYHASNNILQCHYCGDIKPYTACQECNSSNLNLMGIGIEKVEMIAKKLFPQARIARMDSDTMKNKALYQKVIDDMQLGNIDILIGTQMISKGLHFNKVTLVGVIFADQSLYLPDFRASERTFQLLVQVAGRSGRNTKGEVIIQSYNPFHHAIQYAKENDVENFFNEEKEGRKIFNYPPYMQFFLLKIRGIDEEKVINYANEIRFFLTNSLPKECLIQDVVPCIRAKINNIFYYQIIIQAPFAAKIMPILGHLHKNIKLPKNYFFTIDVDAQQVL